MIAYAATSVDLARLLLDLLIVVVAAALLGEVVERIGVPAVIGEICAGVLIGPSVLGLIDLGGERGVSVGVIAEIGVLLLLFGVGMETDLDELRTVGRVSMAVAVIGVAVPFAGGAGVAAAFGTPAHTALFFGAALVATSVGITARVLGDARALATREARIVLGAAVADDVLGLVILTVVVTLATEGSIGVGLVGETVGLATLFLLVSGVAAVRFVPHALRAVQRVGRSASALTAAGLALMFAFAQLAAVADLAFIIGAFMAGIGVGRSEHHRRIEADLRGLGHLFVPVFFVQIGLNADLGAMIDRDVVVLAGATAVVAIAGKLLAALGAGHSGADRWTVGLGMLPRGEVGLIFASIGVTNGILDEQQYGALLIVVLVTTIVAPPLLRRRLAAVGARPAPDTLDVAEPDDGWVRATNGTVGLAATPPAAATAAVALAAARQLTGRRPDEALLDWLGRNRAAPLTWKLTDTSSLVEVLREGDARAWRLLEISGVFDRALPELAAAVQRSRSDLSDLDSFGSLRLPTVTLVAGQPSADDHDLLAAMILDTCTTHSERASLLHRLLPPGGASAVITLAEDAEMVASRGADRTGLSDRERLHLSAHLSTLDHARKVCALAAAMSPDQNHRQAVQAIEASVLDELTSHLIGDETLAAARRRQAQQLTNTRDAADRLEHAASTYVLSHDVIELARQAELIEPPPARGRVRVSAQRTAHPDEWRIDVVTRDAPGLLARIAAALADRNYDVIHAEVATWPDGAVLDSFVVRTPARVDEQALAADIGRRLRQRLAHADQRVAEVDFDDRSTPWRTVCTVRATPAVGLLQAVATAFAQARVVVHAATIDAGEFTTVLRFELSDTTGGKLDRSAEGRVRRALRS
jgi:Kef-type K+ transport system membrane component KefB